MIRYFVVFIGLFCAHTANALIDVSTPNQTLTFYEVVYVGSNEATTAFMVSTKINNEFLCSKVLINHREHDIQITNLPYCIDQISSRNLGEHETHLEVLAINVLNAKINGLYNIDVSDTFYELHVQAHKNKNEQRCQIGYVPNIDVSNGSFLKSESEIYLEVSSSLTIYITRLFSEHPNENTPNKIYQISICQE